MGTSPCPVSCQRVELDTSVFATRDIGIVYTICCPLGISSCFVVFCPSVTHRASYLLVCARSRGDTVRRNAVLERHGTPPHVG